MACITYTLSLVTLVSFVILMSCEAASERKRYNSHRVLNNRNTSTEVEVRLRRDHSSNSHKRGLTPPQNTPLQVNNTELTNNPRQPDEAVVVETKTSPNKTDGGPKRRRKGSKKSRNSRKQKNRRRHRQESGVKAMRYVPKEISSDECRTLWDAKVCGKTLTTQQPNYNLKFWTQSNHSRGSFDLYAKMKDHGALMIARSGLYQLYVQALFKNDHFRSAVSIVVNDKRFFKCVRDMGFQPAPAHHGVIFNTCYSMATLYLYTFDMVQIRIPYIESKIDLHGDSTFFGVVRLSK